MLLSIAFDFVNNWSYTVFLITPIFPRLLTLLKSAGTVFNLSISNLSTFGVKLGKSAFLSNSDVSISVAHFKSDLVVYLKISNSDFTFFYYNYLVLGNKYFFVLILCNDFGLVIIFSLSSC